MKRLKCRFFIVEKELVSKGDSAILYNPKSFAASHLGWSDLVKLSVILILINRLISPLK